LHAAALALLHENTALILQHVRGHFSRADLGWSGEFAAQIVCLLAAKKPSFLSAGNASSLNQDLASFLSNLLPNAKVCDIPVSARGNVPANSDAPAQWTSNQLKSRIDLLVPNAVVRILRFVRLQRPPLLACISCLDPRSFAKEITKPRIWELSCVTRRMEALNIATLSS
jgi:hypothetical protein